MSATHLDHLQAGLKSRNETLAPGSPLAVLVISKGTDHNGVFEEFVTSPSFFESIEVFGGQVELITCEEIDLNEALQPFQDKKISLLMIMDHGDYDELASGYSPEPIEQMAKGAQIVFFSCLGGSPSPAGVAVRTAIANPGCEVIAANNEVSPYRFLAAKRGDGKIDIGFFDYKTDTPVTKVFCADETGKVTQKKFRSLAAFREVASEEALAVFDGSCVLEQHKMSPKVESKIRELSDEGYPLATSLLALQELLKGKEDRALTLADLALLSSSPFSILTAAFVRAKLGKKWSEVEEILALGIERGHPGIVHSFAEITDTFSLPSYAKRAHLFIYSAWESARSLWKLALIACKLKEWEDALFYAGQAHLRGSPYGTALFAKLIQSV